MLRFQGIFSGIPTLARPSSVHSNTTTLVAQQKRFARRTVGKPRPRAALDPDGEPIINSGMYTLGLLIPLLLNIYFFSKT